MLSRQSKTLSTVVFRSRSTSIPTIHAIGFKKNMFSTQPVPKPTPEQLDYQIRQLLTPDQLDYYIRQSLSKEHSDVKNFFLSAFAVAGIGMYMVGKISWIN